MYTISFCNQSKNPKEIIIEHQIPHMVIYSTFAIINGGIPITTKMICIEEEYAPFAILCGLDLYKYYIGYDVIIKPNELFDLELKYT